MIYVQVHIFLSLWFQSAVKYKYRDGDLKPNLAQVLNLLLY